MKVEIDSKDNMTFFPENKKELIMAHKLIDFHQDWNNYINMMICSDITLTDKEKIKNNIR